ncbi:hypothetical protein Micbo1qcDRAFT_180735 [Microdochium bolleyi]|uniref:Uncharacterized protein n=1 Tax=Microdochium bolleyi TaxID=196109 RepID=A0A136ILI8_9PEZI|nr:hypothetical protein Micbo1qcDRAFT_180735 [Microdochium bolleyi]
MQMRSRQRGKLSRTGTPQIERARVCMTDVAMREVPEARYDVNEPREGHQTPTVEYWGREKAKMPSSELVDTGRFPRYHPGTPEPRPRPQQISCQFCGPIARTREGSDDALASSPWTGQRRVKKRQRPGLREVQGAARRGPGQTAVRTDTDATLGTSSGIAWVPAAYFE